MANDYKRRIENAIIKFHEKQLPKKEPMKPRRRNKAPEKAVVKDCLKWAKKMGWDVQVYEAKANYNPVHKKWIGKSMNAGTPDIQGITPDGLFVAIECKAPGRLSTFNREKNYRQQEYIKKTIRMNGFAVVVDSADKLDTIYKKWTTIKKSRSSQEAINYLFQMLPCSTKAT